MSIEKTLKKRMKTSSFSAFWKPEEIGDRIHGEVIRKSPNPWETDQELTEIRTEDGEVLTLPTNVALVRLLETVPHDIGDHLMIEYLGKTKSKRGRDVKTFSIAGMTAEEVEKLGLKSSAEVAEKSTLPEKDDIRRPAKASETSTKKSEPAAEPGYPKGTVTEKIEAFVNDLFGYYPEMSLKEFGHYLNTVKKFDVKPERVIRMMSLTVKDGKVSR